MVKKFSVRRAVRKMAAAAICVVTGWAGLGGASAAAQPAAGYQSPPPKRSRASVFLAGNIDRPLRYTPIGTDFVITNGAEFFNRPLYGGSSPFRVDTGDKPEFSLYLPGRGGNLRLGIQTGAGVKWLNDAKEMVTRYRPGAMIWDFRDPLLGSATLHLAALAPREEEGLLVQAELHGETTTAPVELFFGFGGVNGMRGQRDGDIGCEREPVGKFFQLQPDQCQGNVFALAENSFVVRGQPGIVGGVVSGEVHFRIADAAHWPDVEKLLADAGHETSQPVVIGQIQLHENQKIFIGLQRLAAGAGTPETLAVYREVAGQNAMTNAVPPKIQWPPAALEKRFAAVEQNRRALAERVQVETPDPFINAAAAALNVAADAVWDDRQNAYLHGGVAWRTRLLGWRVSYAGDELGWHDRTAAHFAGFARQQNVTPVPEEISPADARANLARNETSLHSNGDLSKSHYDMNLVGVDAFFRHLLWTGDLDYAREMWPVIERHLAWERRLFRREFGPEKLPLYEAYCCIWASDDLAYNGGGATHSSAYNLYHNRMAARVARRLGQDPAPYEHEAALIAQGMRQELWLGHYGWFGEWKDLLGLQLVHPNAALWTFYHTVDSGVPTPFEAWQMSRFVDTQIAHIPLRGPGVPDGNFTLPTTSWMPYTWSLNNVVMAESTHTALAYWQANRPETAFPLFKGALLDSMYLGLCPGNVGMCTFFDANRRESQRDFGDGSGATSRALVEGLFGVQPDLLAGELIIRPGFPAQWNDAAIRHPDFNFAFHRDAGRETFVVETKFAAPLKLRLQIPARRDAVVAVTVNGQSAAWQVLEDSVGLPRIEIEAAPSRQQQVGIEWGGKNIAPPAAESAVPPQSELQRDLGAKITELADPQGALAGAEFAGSSLHGIATGLPGHRTIFARMEQGSLRWWQPVAFEILAPPPHAAPMDWHQPVRGRLETVDLNPVFNDRVTQIFRNEYRSPRSPFCSLATPKQGIGSWCHPQDKFDVEDSGLRAVAAQSGGKIILPDGVPLATPGAADAKNIAFVSQWDNYPREISVPLNGRSAHAFLLLAGSTGAMQSRFDNGEVMVTYADGSTARLALRNPTTWWPIDQDYYIDDFAFARPEPLPVRVDLQTGKVRVLEMNSFKGTGRVIPGGAATVLDLPLDPAKELKTLTVRALANEVVIGLMSVTLER
jgi:hypothetical protein